MIDQNQIIVECYNLFYNDLSRHHIVKCWMSFIMEHEYQLATKLATWALHLRSVDMADVVLTTSGILTASCGWILHTIMAKSHVISSYCTPYLKCQFLKRAAIMSHVWVMVVFFSHIWYLNNTNYAELFLLHSITYD